MATLASARIRSVDLVRTTAIAIMVVVHFVENLSGVVPKISGFGAPLFTLLSGLSYRLWLDGQLARGASDALIRVRTIRRGLFLIGAGILFNVLVWMPQDVFNWDVLTFIGFGYLMLEWARRMSLLVCTWACAVLLAISPAARVAVDYASFWTAGYFEHDATLSDVLSGLLVSGYFPLLPWLCYPLLGFLVASVLFSHDRTSRREISWCAKLGALLLAASLTALALESLWPALLEGLGGRWLGGWTNYPATPEFVSGTLGIALLFFAAAYRWLDSPDAQAWPRLELWIGRYSRHAFTLYVLHHIVHLWPLWGLAAARGEETTQYWQRALSPWPALALAVVFLALTAPLLDWMERRRVRGVEDWMRWICD